MDEPGILFCGRIVKKAWVIGPINSETAGFASGPFPDLNGATELIGKWGEYIFEVNAQGDFTQTHKWNGWAWMLINPADALKGALPNDTQPGGRLLSARPKPSQISYVKGENNG